MNSRVLHPSGRRKEAALSIWHSALSIKPLSVQSTSWLTSWVGPRSPQVCGWAVTQSCPKSTSYQGRTVFREGGCALERVPCPTQCWFGFQHIWVVFMSLQRTPTVLQRLSVFTFAKGHKPPLWGQNGRQHPKNVFCIVHQRITKPNSNIYF